MIRAMRKRKRAMRSSAWTTFDRLGPRWTLECVYRGAGRGRCFRTKVRTFRRLKGPAAALFPFTWR
jgi:hypothetical protein